MSGTGVISGNVTSAGMYGSKEIGPRPSTAVALEREASVLVLLMVTALVPGD